MKATKATFVKKNGEERTMEFVKLCDLPNDFLNEKLKGTGKVKTLGEGRELVWCLTNHGFRVFDWNTVKGEIVTYDVKSF